MQLVIKTKQDREIAIESYQRQYVKGELSAIELHKMLRWVYSQPITD